MKKDLTPGTIHAVAVAALPARDIDHHNSDLYLRVTQESTALIARFQYRHTVTTFVDNIDHVLWYDLPFCFTPFWENPSKYT